MCKNNIKNQIMSAVLFKNNQGIDLMANQSNPVAAIASLRQALKLLHSVIDSSKTLVRDNVADSSVTRTLEFETASARSSSTTSSLEHESSCPIFDRYFHARTSAALPTSQGQQEQDLLLLHLGGSINADDMQLVVVMVLYNIALTYHLLGLCKGPGRRVNYARAMRGYNMAMTILQNTLTNHKNDNTAMTASWYHLLLAVANNMVSLSLETSDYHHQSFERYLDWMEYGMNNIEFYPDFFTRTKNF